MKTNVCDTSIACYHKHVKPIRPDLHARILAFIADSGTYRYISTDWSIGELAHELGLDKSNVSARIHELLKLHLLVVMPRRKDRRSGVMIRPVGLPDTQRDLFQ